MITDKQKRQLMTLTAAAIKRGNVSTISLRKFTHHVAFAPGNTYGGGKVVVQRDIPGTAYIA